MRSLRAYAGAPQVLVGGLKAWHGRGRAPARQAGGGRDEGKELREVEVRGPCRHTPGAGGDAHCLGPFWTWGGTGMMA